MILLSVLTSISEGIEYLGDNLDWGMIALYLFLALGVSFLCSLLEAIILSVTWSHIEILKKEEKGAKRTACVACCCSVFCSKENPPEERKSFILL